MFDNVVYGLFEQREKWLESCVHKHGDPNREPIEQVADFALMHTSSIVMSSSSYDAVLWKGDMPVGVYAERFAPGRLVCIAYDYIPGELPDGFNRHLLDAGKLREPVVVMADD